MGDRFKNAREYPRASLQVPVQVVRGSGVVSCRARDVGEGGIALHTWRLRVNETVKLFVPLPLAYGERAQMQLLHGKVVWSAQRCSGVCFVDVPRDVHQRLREYVRSSA